MPDSAAAATAAPPHKEPPRRHPGNGKERFNDHMPPLLIGQADLIGVLVLVGLLGLNLGVKLYFKNEKDLHDIQKLENQNLQHQLEYLKYQINPHFFMNTLNNIHALVDIDPDKAKTTIVELSRMMRYVLYEGDKSLIPIPKEVEFLRNYVRLMKLRYTDKVNVDVDIPANLSEGLIPPLLLITFLENAFKHGVSYEQESFISIIMDAEDGNLIFRCINSKKAPAKTSEGVPSEGGLGLKNIKQRLDLIYGSRYKLDLNDSEKTYEVYLSIPLNAEAIHKVKSEEG
jgi:LytS/YehU family sensor histidine kinase